MKIDLKILVALCNAAASKEDTRFYLNGVLIQPDGDKHAIAVATDGHVIVAWRFAVTDGEADSTWRGGLTDEGVIVPRTMLEKVKIRQRSSGEGDIVFDKESVTINHPEAGALTMQAVDGSFPTWRRAFPEGGYTQTPAHYSATILARLEKLASVIGGQLQIYPNGPSPALITLETSGDFIGAIMPRPGESTRQEMAPLSAGWARPVD